MEPLFPLSLSVESWVGDKNGELGEGELRNNERPSGSRDTSVNLEKFLDSLLKYL